MRKYQLILWTYLLHWVYVLLYYICPKLVKSK